MTWQTILPKNMKVLIVDDDKDICETLKEILESDGYAAEYCLTGEAALNELKSNPYDAVILDVKMPDTDGIETFNNIRLINPHQQIILSSGLDIDEKQKAAIKEGAFGVIQKPIDFDSLYETLGAIQKIGKLILIAGVNDDDVDTLADGFSIKEFHIHTANSANNAIKKLIAINYNLFIITTKFVQSNWQKLLKEIIELRTSASILMETDFYKLNRSLADHHQTHNKIIPMENPLDVDEICKILCT